MFESMYVFLYEFASSNFLMLLGCAIFFFLLPGFIVIRFVYPEEKSKLPEELKKLAIQVFLWSIPSGLLFGVAFLITSTSIRGLVIIPILILGFSTGEAIVVSLGILRRSQKYYNSKK